MTKLKTRKKKDWGQIIQFYVSGNLTERERECLYDGVDEILQVIQEGRKRRPDGAGNPDDFIKGNIRWYDAKKRIINETITLICMTASVIINGFLLFFK